MLADGEYLHVTLLKDQEQDKPDASSASAESPELKLKGFASSNSKAGSLLSRLGAPVKPVTGLSNGKRRPNDVSLDYTKSLLHPYGNLLAKAGVDSVDTLRRLVRPGTVKEYIEMLCKEYPDEKLLEGLTARWALKERLEEWLGEKEALKMAWEQEEGPEVKLEEV